MAAMKYYSVEYFFQEYDSWFLRRKVGEVRFRQVRAFIFVVLGGVLFDFKTHVFNPARGAV